MPLIPKFTITQDDDFVLVTITLPHIRVSSAEIIADGFDFSFFCQPYLLKLTFPCEFHEDVERCKAVYDPCLNNGTLIAHLPKKNIGEHFPDLDLTTNLLQLRKEKEIGSTDLDGIEVLNSQEFDNCNDDITYESQDCKGNNGLSSLLSTSREVRYGFSLRYSRVLVGLRDELVDMLEIRDPDTVPLQARRAMRLRSENMRFDAQRYLGDFFEGEADPLYLEAMAHSPPWVQQWDLHRALDKAERAKKKQSQQSDMSGLLSTTEATATGIDVLPLPSSSKDRAFEQLGGFTADERDALSSGLKHREYLIATGSKEETAALLTLADVLFAFCYDVRITAGEERNVESAANIARLSSALSWLDPFLADDVSSTIKFSLRRSVILPYLRVWKLSRKVLADVAKVLFLGKRTVLKCLLAARGVFERTDTHYLLNKLFLDDLCVWVQSIPDSTLQAFAKDYNSAKTAIETAPNQGREHMGLRLPDLEQWALHQQQQQSLNGDEEEEEEEDSSDSESEGSSSSDEEEEDSEDDDDDDNDDDDDDDAPGDDSAWSIPKHLLQFDSAEYLSSSSELAYLHCAEEPVEQEVQLSEAEASSSSSVEAVGTLLSRTSSTNTPLPVVSLPPSDVYAEIRGPPPSEEEEADDEEYDLAHTGDMKASSNNRRVLIEVLSDSDDPMAQQSSISAGSGSVGGEVRSETGQFLMKAVSTIKRRPVVKATADCEENVITRETAVEHEFVSNLQRLSIDK